MEFWGSWKLLNRLWACRFVLDIVNVIVSILPIVSIMRIVSIIVSILRIVSIMRIVTIILFVTIILLGTYFEILRTSLESCLEFLWANNRTVSPCKTGTGTIIGTSGLIAVEITGSII
jgi:hypothetical protein